ncbi:MAG TPA: isocitrate lyase/phosphoenolpyruvate mutase family protein [Mycobacteriales bacterium]|jgi:2-methylisocitrate lyase-like PEP mutase family enzyme|nr:isocitrate lyase/phosphoenolpyruvate mutase family protein [Mycobacteriales bacterium]
MSDLDVRRLSTLAAQLRDAHHAGGPLVLPNAWDAASARSVAAAGFPVATTSGGVAAALGYPDGERIPADEMFAAAARIAAAVDVPVTADIESGYGLSPDELVTRLLAAGVVGCNLEDTDHRERGALVPVDVQAQRLADVKEAAQQQGVDIVVNARVDVFVQQVGSAGERVALSLQRAAEYVAAGADCVYPILANAEQLAEFAASHPGPVNGMVRPTDPTLAELLRLGIARISFGSGLHRSTDQDLQRRLAAIAQGSDDWSAAPDRA